MNPCRGRLQIPLMELFDDDKCNVAHTLFYQIGRHDRVVGICVSAHFPTVRFETNLQQRHTGAGAQGGRKLGMAGPVARSAVTVGGYDDSIRARVNMLDSGGAGWAVGACVMSSNTSCIYGGIKSVTASTGCTETPTYWQSTEKCVSQ